MINRYRPNQSSHERLLDVIGSVRTRWRMKLALKGAAVVASAGLIAFVLSAIGLERLGFSPGAIVGFRVLVFGALLALTVRYLLLPLLRRVSDEQVALYLEEHEPSLQAAVVSAVELRDVVKGSRSDLSPALARRTIEGAIEKCRAVEEGRRIDQPQINRFATMLASAVVAGLALALFMPGLIRNGAGALLNPFKGAADSSPYSIEVTPGSVTIPRGADQAVSATLHGFTSEFVEIVVRTGADSAFERLPMIAAADSGAFELLLFDLDQVADYYIESNGVRSPVYRIDVADLPYVQNLRLEYYFPAYTGLSPRIVEEGGDIAVLKGTVVKLLALPTIPVASGRIAVDGAQPIPLAAGDSGRLVGSMRVQQDGFYHIELAAKDGALVTASPQYTIDILTDMPPTVSFSKPGRDARVSPIEEVFVEATAEDDFGVGAIDLVYSVNGGEEETQRIFEAARALQEATAGHTFYLEELGLEPGDIVSYYARVTDNNDVGGRKTATSDIYFLNVRPYSLDYRQAEQAGGGGGGGGGGQQDEGQLSERQREIVAATFNLQRDSARYTAEEYRENMVTIALSQDRLREQVETLAQRMRNRGVTDDSSFAKIGELLPQASAEMVSAAEQLKKFAAAEALPPEQKALQLLQRAEAVFRDVQVQMGQQQQGGGGGGGGSPNAEDLADLFELELDKLRNQYETVERGEREQAENEVDETMERLKELARRQQQEAERMRRQQQMQGGAAAGNADSQRQLADETEELARQLERLSREQSDPQLMDTARRLQEAADAMRRSAANTRSGSNADANAALDRLEEARRRLERNQSQALKQQAEDALRRAEQIAQDQQEIANQMRQLGSAAGADRRDQSQRLIERKDQQAADVANLERQLERMAQDARGEENDAARKLQEASNSVRDNQVKEKIRYSRALTMPGADPTYANAVEREIGENLDELRDRIAEANQAIGQSAQADQSSAALDRARELVRGVESMEEQQRAQEERRLGQQGQQGQDQQGQQGQQGQGQQGQQQGQPGQGQQGQSQQGQGQQGQGQRGQEGPQGQQGQGQPGQGQPGQGQQGQQSQQGQGGQRGDGNPQGADGRRLDGSPMGGGGGGDASGQRYDPRQFRNTAGQRIDDARALREELAREGRDVTQLDEVIRYLEALQRERTYTDPQEVARLLAAVVDGAKQFEYSLRRELQGADGEKLLLSGSDEVPEGFRKMVEEYYRALSRNKNK